MSVLDASAVVEWLLRLPLAGAVGERWSDPETPLHAPHLLTVEVAAVVRRYVLAGEVSASRGEQALTDLADLDVNCHPHGPLLPAMWRLRANLTAYDASYVVLAMVLDQELVTLDTRIANAPGHHARVDLVR